MTPIQFLLIALLLSYGKSAMAWIPPAKIIFDCAEGKAVNMPNPMKAESISWSARDCRQMIISQFRTSSHQFNAPKGLCVPSDIKDDLIYQSVLKFYQGNISNYLQATYMQVIDEGLWKIYACSAESRLNHIREVQEAREKNEFLSNVQLEFNNLAYHSEHSGKTFCVPRNGGEHSRFLEKNRVKNLEEWKKLHLINLLKKDYICAKP